MPVFLRDNTFSFTINGRDIDEPGTVVEARLNDTGTAGVGCLLSFQGYRRDQFTGMQAPVSQSDTFYADRLIRGGRDGLGRDINALAREDLTGASARDAVYALFHELVLADPDTSFIDDLGNDWLRELRDEALAEAVR